MTMVILKDQYLQGAKRTEGEIVEVIESSIIDSLIFTKCAMEKKKGKGGKKC